MSSDSPSKKRPKGKAGVPYTVPEAQASLQQEGTEGAPEPFKVKDLPQVSLGIEPDNNIEMIMPWMHFAGAFRQNEQMMIQIGEWEIRMTFDFEKLRDAGFRVGEIMDGIHEQKLAWVRHQPDLGLSVTAVKQEKEDEKEPEPPEGQGG